MLNYNEYYYMHLWALKKLKEIIKGFLRARKKRCNNHYIMNTDLSP